VALASPIPNIRGAVARISFGAWFELYDLFMTAYVSLGLIKAGLFTATAASPFAFSGFASFVSCGFAGMFFGTIIFSGISDRFGRKAAFMSSLVWYSICTLVMAFMPNGLWIDFWRFLAGVGIGVQLVTSDAYTSEIVPKEERGRWVAFTQVVGYTSIPVAALLAYLLVPHTILGLDGWRYVAMFGALGGALIWFVLPGLPDSSRWQRAHEKVAHAGPAFVLRTIFNPFYRARTIMLVVFNLVQTIGFYGFNSWVPIFLASQGVEFTHSLQYSFFIAIINPVGPLLAMIYAERFQRKWQICVLALVVGGVGLCFAIARAPLLLVAFGTIVTLANAWFSASFHTYQAELFPTRIRGQAVGFVYAWSRFSSIFIPFLIAAVLRANGTIGVFAMICTAMVIVTLDIGIFGPKTNGRDLDELSPL
jgi:MFS transporter, putative metabolite:H+ symporter